MTDNKQIHKCDLGGLYKSKPMSYAEWESEIRSKIKSGMTVLDAGAGEGKAVRLINHVDNAIYIGIDNGVGCDDWDYSKVLKLDLYDLNEFENEKFDVVFLFQVLEHLDNPEKALSEICRVTKSNGHVFISVPLSQSIHQVPHDYYRYTPYGLRVILRRHGFEMLWISPQLYGEFQASLRRLQWSLSYLCECNALSKVIYRPFSLLVRLIEKIAPKYDSKLSIHAHPIGYFACFEKLIHEMDDERARQ